jgi:hypothetical protein
MDINTLQGSITTMSKSIIAIETPYDCSNCPLCSEDHMTYRDYCRITNYHIFTSDKPYWCPLKPLPEKYDMETAITHDLDYDGDYEYGYNACIDEILGEIK